MGLGYYLIKLDKTASENFHKEFYEFILYFQNFLQNLDQGEIEKERLIQPPRYHERINRHKNFSQDISVSQISLKMQELNVQDVLFPKIKQYYLENEQALNHEFSKFSWYNIDSRDKYVNILMIIILTSWEKNCSIKEAFEVEWKEILLIQTQSLSRSIILLAKNLKLPADFHIKFTEVQEQIPYPTDFVCTFQPFLRSITQKEIINFNLNQYTGNTILDRIAIIQIDYNIPSLFQHPKYFLKIYNLTVEEKKEEIKKSRLKIQEIIYKITNTMLKTLLLVCGASVQVFPQKAYSVNLYNRLFFPEPSFVNNQIDIMQLSHSNYIPICQIMADQTQILIDLQANFYSLIEDRPFYELLNQYDGVDYVYSINTYQSIVMYWTVLEALTNCRGFFLMAAAAWCYDCKIYPKREEEFRFWKKINYIRNLIVHGKSTKNILKFIENNFPGHNLETLVLTIRDKIRRIMLFCYFIYDQSSKDIEFPKIVFNWIEQKNLGELQNFTQIQYFREIIQFNNHQNLLGLFSQYKEDYQIGDLDKFKDLAQTQRMFNINI